MQIQTLSENYIACIFLIVRILLQLPTKKLENLNKIYCMDEGTYSVGVCARVADSKDLDWELFKCMPRVPELARLRLNSGELLATKQKHIYNIFMSKNANSLILHV